MKYDITKPSAPAMPTLGKGTECIRLLLSQTSKDMHEPLVPMLSSLLGEHVCVAGNGLTTTFGKVHCGQMAIQVAESGGNRGKVSHSVFGT